MRLRKDRPARSLGLRWKITAVLLSLAALWGFAAWVTVQDGVDLLQTSEVDDTAGRPTKTLITALQDERRLSLVHLGNPKAGRAQELTAQRARTDQTIEQWRRKSAQAPGRVIRHIAETRRRLETLDRVRGAIDIRSASAADAAREFNSTIDAAFGILAVNADVDDNDTAADARGLIALTRARELLSREDAFLAGVLAQGRFGTGDVARWTQTVGVSRQSMDEATAQLAPGDQARLQEFISSPAYTGLRATEDRLLAAKGRSAARPNLTAAQWQVTTRTVMAQLDKMIDIGGDAVVKRAQPGAYGVIARLAIVAGLGAAAVLFSIVLALTTARSLLAQLRRLRLAADDLADNRLPAVMQRLSHGEKVDVAAEAPGLRFGDDEIGQVGQAFNRVQIQAIQAAVGQAEQRLGFRETLQNLAQRSQVLIAQQRSVIDRMERRKDLARDEIADLYETDELNTRIQRYLENVLLLSGGQPSRGVRRPIDLFDAIRIALGQVEGYHRVKVRQPARRFWLSGRAIDVTRLLAELIENGLTYSGPDTQVEIDVQETSNGVAITIEDKGLGLSEEQLAEYNQMLSRPPGFENFPTRLGLFVVAYIGQRHGVHTTLKRSAFGGVLAVTLLPFELFETAEQDVPAAVTGPVNLTPRDGYDGAVAVLPHNRTSTAALRAVPPIEALDAFAPQAVVQDQTRVEAPRQEPAPGVPAPAGPEEPADAADGFTPHGLPVRQPQQSLNPALRDEPAGEAEQAESDDRTPEQALRIMGAFQRGTQAGREAAARPADEHTDAPAAPDREAGTEL
ncbi:sensor histidine kinase [Actinomadura macrotermitis]|uniref:histidine kinase n=1 Tax=Actinomadura macrotermitis TaxID=2585200 RepID=A0A7K0BYK0_9ACTN|nr:nitrate- and nitrite sensing domain-containing protein [Actinomadura macrotermitis]MQY06261.1 hypothetical protein [Actinomadura macrotermitis]